MRIDSGLKAFDRQVGALGVGNRISDGQSSVCLRPYSLLLCNGSRFGPGELQRFDLRMLGDLISAEMLALVERECRDRHSILYVFHHRTRRGRTIVHGELLTGSADEDHREIGRVAGPRRESEQVLAVCAAYVSNPPLPRLPARPQTLAAALGAPRLMS